jgi:hypothetical protein
VHFWFHNVKGSQVEVLWLKIETQMKEAASVKEWQFAWSVSRLRSPTSSITPVSTAKALALSL